MEKKYCENCICLVEGKNGEWVCDEANCEIEQLSYCPEKNSFNE